MKSNTHARTHTHTKTQINLFNQDRVHSRTKNVTTLQREEGGCYPHLGENIFYSLGTSLEKACVLTLFPESFSRPSRFLSKIGRLKIDKARADGKLKLDK